MADERFFKKPHPQTLAALARLVGADLTQAADDQLLISDVGPMHLAEPCHITFLTNKKYTQSLAVSRAGACIIEADMVAYAPKTMALLIVKNAHVAYAKIAQSFYPAPQWHKTYIAPNAFIHPTATIGANCIIDHNVYIGRGAQIGKNCWLKPNTVIGPQVILGDNCLIGSNCSISHAIIGHHVRLLPGARVGQEGFGFAVGPEGVVDIPQLGRVLIGNYVLVGANCTIDRGAGPDTEIGDFTMIDNLVQVAHNVSIGKGCVIAAQVGISGSTVIEDYVMFGGQAGVAGHLTVGRAAKVAAKSGVTKDIAAYAEVMGYPAINMKDYLRQIVALAQMVKSRHNTKK